MKYWYRTQGEKYTYKYKYKNMQYLLFRTGEHQSTVKYWHETRERKTAEKFDIFLKIHSDELVNWLKSLQEREAKIKKFE